MVLFNNKKLSSEMNTVYYKTFISAITIHQKSATEYALKIFKSYYSKGYEEGASVVGLLQDCAKRKDLSKGIRLHAYIQNKGYLASDIYVGSTLVDMYAKCGALTKAEEVFHELPHQNLVSWTSLIAGYGHQGHGHEAMACFERLKQEGFCPDEFAVACVLKACGNSRMVIKGLHVHAKIAKQGMLENNVSVGNALVDMYCKCGLLVNAQEVFDELTMRNLMSWTSLIAGYTQEGRCEEAINCYKQMQFEGVKPDASTLIYILKACGTIREISTGEEIHSYITKTTTLGNNYMVGTAVLNMYVKCGDIAKAREIFDSLVVQNVVSWTALIAGFSEQGKNEETLKCFGRMQCEGILPDACTFTCLLKACGNVEAIDKGHTIHAKVHIESLTERNIAVATALVDMYGKCGELSAAESVFRKIKDKDVTAWSVLCSAYVQHGQSEDALDCYRRLCHDGIAPNETMFISIMKACGNTGASSIAEAIHKEIIRERLLEKNVPIGNALVDMYVKCGEPERAEQVFDKLPVKDVVSWTSLIAGYSQIGKDEIICNLFDKMLDGGVKPDIVTYTVVLNTCSHLGLVSKGQMYFENMFTHHGIIPTVQHHTCLVDLFGRAGHISTAVAVISKMQHKEYLPIWIALLSACRKWEYLSIGRWAFEHVKNLDQKNASPFICISNIYAASATDICDVSG